MASLSSYGGAFGMSSVDKKLEGRWSSPDLASQLLPEFVSALANDFGTLETPVKLRAMLAFLALSERRMEPVLPGLLRILDQADATDDAWLPVVSGLVREWLDLKTDEDAAANGDGKHSRKRKKGRTPDEAAISILKTAAARTGGGGGGGGLPKVVETPYFFPMELPYLSKRLQPAPELYRNRHFFAKTDEFLDEIGGDDWDFHSITAAAGGNAGRFAPSQPAATAASGTASTAPNSSAATTAATAALATAAAAAGAVEAAAAAGAAAAEAAAGAPPAGVPAPLKQQQQPQQQVFMAPQRAARKERGAVPLLSGSAGLVRDRVHAIGAGGGSLSSIGGGVGVAQRPRPAPAMSRAGGGKTKVLAFDEARQLGVSNLPVPGAKSSSSSNRGSGGGFFVGGVNKKLKAGAAPAFAASGTPAAAAAAAESVGASADAAIALLADVAAVAAAPAQALSNWEVPASSAIPVPAMAAPPPPAAAGATAEAAAEALSNIFAAIKEHLASLSAADREWIEEFSRLVEGGVPGGGKKRIKLQDGYSTQQDGSLQKETLFLNLIFEDKTWSFTRKVKRVGKEKEGAAAAEGGAAGGGD